MKKLCTILMTVCSYDCKGAGGTRDIPVPFKMAAGGGQRYNADTFW